MIEKMEEFRTVTGYENYEVSNFGNIRNKKKGKNVNGWVNNKGYRHIRIAGIGVVKVLKFHRICAIEFIENPNNYPCVNHKDGNKLNNHVSNLEWCSVGQNNIHALSTGLRINPPGELNHRSKLTNSDIFKIREMLINGHTGTYIAFLFSVKKSAISHIKNGRNWKHI